MNNPPPSQEKIILNSGLLETKSLQYYVSSENLPSSSSFPDRDDILPIIDLQEDRALVATQIAEACHNWGFLQIRNHGLPLELLDRLRARAYAFFELPLEQKQRAGACPANNFFGYGLRDNPRSYFPNAWLETFLLQWSPVSHIRDHIEKVGLPSPETDDFCGVVEEYVDKAEKLVVRLTELVAQGLGLEPTTFSRHLGKLSSTNIRMNYYPPCPQPSVTLGIGAHSDFNLFTVLLQDSVPGLQVLKDNEWVTVKPIADALLVNVADGFEAWTNRRAKSVMHRVLVNTSSPRLSMALFYMPHPDTVIEPPPELIDAEHPRHYRTFVVKEMGEQLNKYKATRAANKVSGYQNLLQHFLL